jgi:hypothetical protein
MSEELPMLQFPSALQAEIEASLWHAGMPTSAAAASPQWGRDAREVYQWAHGPHAQHARPRRCLPTGQELPQTPARTHATPSETARDVWPPHPDSGPRAPSPSLNASAVGQAPCHHLLARALPPTTRTHRRAGEMSP